MPIKKYASNLFSYERFSTRKIKIGELELGGDAPIRVQSMTTSDTMNTDACVEESIKMIEAGCELVRLTAPSKNEAQNLQVIKEKLREKGFQTPLVADIHFTPNAAEIAAKLVEKVRINPGNYADKKKFENIDYTDETYNAEILRIEEKFVPLIRICKENNTAMRIGTNHGSLSDRILSRYGDTPEGMVESAMEFIRICEKERFYDLVISMKASNTLVMVQAYRLLVATMRENNMNYPLHLGVTEAGDGEDGRVKSAVGIGSLLIDGLGDTVRVSLTEAAENEIPVARDLIDICTEKPHLDFEIQNINWDPYNFNRRKTQKLLNIGDKTVPNVLGDLSRYEKIKPSHLFNLGYAYSIELDKWNIRDAACDLIYLGKNELDFEIPGTLNAIIDYDVWKTLSEPNKYHPILYIDQLKDLATNQIAFLNINHTNDLESLSEYSSLILVLNASEKGFTYEARKTLNQIEKYQLPFPILLKFQESNKDYSEEKSILNASAKLGSLLIDGLVDGIWIENKNLPISNINGLSFSILQATRQRISKTEYISCPSCGRTLFDLQETTAKIRSKTSHLKGLKIGIMGCIVNGPGEMADADYGYVGTGPGKINLYKEKTVVRKNINETEAVKELIDLIKENGDWVEPS